MYDILSEIIDQIKRTGTATDSFILRILHRRNKEEGFSEQFYAKKKLLPYYTELKHRDYQKWQSWNIDEETELELLRILQIKPRRTASGVATITVITKPWTCSGDCLYCPNDIRMPKSYLSDEPACQRAERNYFDPYLQVVSRLNALRRMGHRTDKIELIVLGGTWNDYPESYRIWFVHELFRALNDISNGIEEARADARRKRYEDVGISCDSETLKEQTNYLQNSIDRGDISFNEAIYHAYFSDDCWRKASSDQVARLSDLYVQHAINSDSAHRVVGLVVETRPDRITIDNLTLLRQLGCTKVQIGVQTLNEDILSLNQRGTNTQRTAKAFGLLRLFGFKIHAHFMVNLLGQTPESDMADYLNFISCPDFQPDEVKIYPCVLVKSARLREDAMTGAWKPYDEEQLIDILAYDISVTPSYTRISRMIRDISAHDIIAGNKKTNLRQLVEKSIDPHINQVKEMRYREINAKEISLKSLKLEVISYVTSVSDERFLQFVTEDGSLAGFLRLSFPRNEIIRQLQPNFPIKENEAMIREVHVYGKVAGLQGKTEGNAQHLGLGKRLVDKACELAGSAGYDRINIISSVGTRRYYESLGFRNNGLYQQRRIIQNHLSDSSNNLI